MKTEDYKNLLKKLPTTSGIHGQTRQLNSAVLVPFIEKEGGYHILFELRARDIAQGGEVCFPGGLFDKELDASYQDWRAAVRVAVRHATSLPGAEKKFLLAGINSRMIVVLGLASLACLC